MLPLIFSSLFLFSMIILLFVEVNLVSSSPINMTANKTSLIDVILNKLAFIFDAHLFSFNLNPEGESQKNDQNLHPNKSDMEIDEMIRITNKKLEQSLNTLVYIFKMESNFRLLESDHQLEDLKVLRRLVREKTLRLTEKLNHYQKLKANLQNEEVAA